MKTSTTFKEYNDNYPCDECSAPCCKYLLIPHKSPTKWMDLDFIKYILNFPNIRVTVSIDGDWGILINQDCIHFNSQTQKCEIHNTLVQPKTCAYFNPYQCNYKFNLEDKKPFSLYILDRENFDHWVQHIRLNKNGQIMDAPNFEKSINILKKNE